MSVILPPVVGGMRASFLKAVGGQVHFGSVVLGPGSEGIQARLLELQRGGKKM